MTDSNIRPGIRKYFKLRTVNTTRHSLDPVQGPLCYLDVVLGPLSGEIAGVLSVNLDMLDAVLRLQMLHQLGLRLELAGAAQHVTGEGVGRLLVNFDRLLVRKLVSTEPAAQSFQLGVGQALVPPGDVTVQLWLRIISPGTFLELTTERVALRSMLGKNLFRREFFPTFPAVVPWFPVASGATRFLVAWNAL